MVTIYEKSNHLSIAGERPSMPGDGDTPGFLDDGIIRDIATWVLKRYER